MGNLSPAAIFSRSFGEGRAYCYKAKIVIKELTFYPRELRTSGTSGMFTQAARGRPLQLRGLAAGVVLLSPIPIFLPNVPIIPRSIRKAVQLQEVPELPAF